MRRGMRNILITAVTGVTVGAAMGAQQESPCKGWPTEEFFREATAAKIVACLDAGADPNVRSRFDGTPLQEALNRGDPAIIEALLAAGADPNVRGSTETVSIAALVCSLYTPFAYIAIQEHRLQKELETRRERDRQKDDAETIIETSPFKSGVKC